jgi:hypothetical protein
LRRLPAQRADRWRGVRDAEKLIDRPMGQTANWPIGGARYRPAGASGSRPAEGARGHRGRSRDQRTDGESGDR